MGDEEWKLLKDAGRGQIEKGRKRRKEAWEGKGGDVEVREGKGREWSL